MHINSQQDYISLQASAGSSRTVEICKTTLLGRKKSGNFQSLREMENEGERDLFPYLQHPSGEPEVCSVLQEDPISHHLL